MSSTAPSPSVIVVGAAEVYQADLETSFSMNGLQVLYADNVNEALSIIKSKLPLIIFVRLTVEGNESAAVDIREDLFKYDGLCDLPIIILDSEEGLSARAPYVTRFSGSAELPIQFPSFPKFVAKLLESPGITEHLSERANLLEGTSLSKPSQVAGQVSSNQSSASTTQRVTGAGSSTQSVERRKIVVHAILLRVLDEIFEDQSLHQLSLDEIPQVVERITSEVCSTIDLKGLFA